MKNLQHISHLQPGEEGLLKSLTVVHQDSRTIKVQMIKVWLRCMSIREQEQARLIHRSILRGGVRTQTLNRKLRETDQTQLLRSLASLLRREKMHLKRNWGKPSLTRNRWQQPTLNLLQCPPLRLTITSRWWFIRTQARSAWTPHHPTPTPRIRTLRSTVPLETQSQVPTMSQWVMLAPRPRLKSTETKAGIITLMSMTQVAFSKSSKPGRLMNPRGTEPVAVVVAWARAVEQY